MQDKHNSILFLKFPGTLLSANNGIVVVCFDICCIARTLFSIHKNNGGSFAAVFLNWTADLCLMKIAQAITYAWYDEMLLFQFYLGLVSRHSYSSGYCDWFCWLIFNLVVVAHLKYMVGDGMKFLIKQRWVKCLQSSWRNFFYK